MGVSRDGAADEGPRGVSVIVPAFNEAAAVGDTVRRIRESLHAAGVAYEVIVVDDGSADATADEAERAGATVVRHATNIGYGNAILTGAGRARYALLALTDADGTYPVDELPAMIDDLQRRGLDMLVGARQGRYYQGGMVKSASRVVFKLLAEFTTGRHIPDINSGLRVFRRDLVRRYGAALCGGFSFTTTLTVIAMLTHHFVAYRPIAYHRRVGRSKVRYLRDVLRAAQILVSTIAIFNPIKLYILLALAAAASYLPLVAAAALFPHYSGCLLLAGMALAAVYGLIAVGMLAEQHRAAAQGLLRRPRGEE